jgi:hypothetical protein
MGHFRAFVFWYGNVQKYLSIAGVETIRATEKKC